MLTLYKFCKHYNLSLEIETDFLGLNIKLRDKTNLRNVSYHFSDHILDDLSLEEDTIIRELLGYFTNELKLDDSFVIYQKHIM